MRTRFNIRSIIFVVLFGLLAACAQKPETNSPEVTKQRADDLRNAASGTFIRSFADHVARITYVSKEKDTFTAIEPDGTFRTYSIAAIAKTIDEVVPPGNQNYVGFKLMFQNESVARTIRKSGMYAFVVDRNGTIGRIINPTTAGILQVKWDADLKSSATEIEWLAKRVVRVVPVSDKDYDTFAGKYCRNEKAW